MKRFFGLILAVAFAAMVATTAMADTTSQTFTVSVGNIVKFITIKTDNSTNTTAIDDWDVEEDSGSDASGTNWYADTSVVFRLVMNTDVTLTASAGSTGAMYFKQTTSGEPLLTYANIISDGAGTGTATTDGSGHATGQALTGFASAAQVAANGVGKDGNNNLQFVYVGGGQSVVGGYDTPTDSTSNGAVYAASGTFLGSSGSTITHVAQDGAVLLTLTLRAMNGEDFGAASDNTEAPDTGTYTASITLTTSP